MARARNIKPGFFMNETLAECPPLARLLFAGLWCVSDRSGRLEDRPRKLKAELLPYDDCDANALLSVLHSKGFIRRYEKEGQKYIQIIKFDKHQNPHVREPESSIPAPDEHSASTVQEPEQTGTGPADSLLLIPDSLNLIPDSPIQGLTAPAVLPKKKKNEELRKQASEIIEFLNAKTGRTFDLNGVNADHVVARLKDGESVEDCRAIIALKCRQWLGDPKMITYLRPETLFGRTKFASYKGELEAKNE